MRLSVEKKKFILTLLLEIQEPHLSSKSVQKKVSNKFNNARDYCLHENNFKPKKEFKMSLRYCYGKPVGCQKKWINRTYRQEPPMKDTPVRQAIDLRLICISNIYIYISFITFMKRAYWKSFIPPLVQSLNEGKLNVISVTCNMW